MNCRLYGDRHLRLPQYIWKLKQPGCYHRLLSEWIHWDCVSSTLTSAKKRKINWSGYQSRLESVGYVKAYENRALFLPQKYANEEKDINLFFIIKEIEKEISYHSITEKECDVNVLIGVIKKHIDKTIKLRDILLINISATSYQLLFLS